jgi:hypothetical protein
MRYNVTFDLLRPEPRKGTDSALPGLAVVQRQCAGQLSTAQAVQGGTSRFGTLDAESALLTTWTSLMQGDMVQVVSALQRDGEAFLRQTLTVRRVSMLSNLHYQAEVKASA